MRVLRLLCKRSDQGRASGQKKITATVAHFLKKSKDIWLYKGVVLTLWRKLDRMYFLYIKT